MFPCGWEGSILTPRDPWTQVFAGQPRVRTDCSIAEPTMAVMNPWLLQPRLLYSRSHASASRRTQQASCLSTRRSTGSSSSRTSLVRCRSCCTPRCLTVSQPSLRHHITLQHLHSCALTTRCRKHKNLTINFVCAVLRRVCGASGPCPGTSKGAIARLPISNEPCGS